MRMNELQPAAGSHKSKRRVGRGLVPASVKPQHAVKRAKGSFRRRRSTRLRRRSVAITNAHSKVWIPLTCSSEHSRGSLSELAKVEGEQITLDTLKQAKNVSRHEARAYHVVWWNRAAVTVDGANIAVPRVLRRLSKLLVAKSLSQRKRQLRRRKRHLKLRLKNQQQMHKRRTRR